MVEKKADKDKTEEVEQTASVEESQEEIQPDEDATPEKVPQTKEVETPEKSELSKSEQLQLRIDEMQQERQEEHLKEQKKLLEDIKCPACDSKKIRKVGAAKNSKFGVKPEEYMEPPEQGMKSWTKADNYECKDCGKISYIGVTYKLPPENMGAAEITLRDQGHPWQAQSPFQDTDEHIKLYISEQAELVKNNQSTLDSHNQRVIRALDLALNK